MTVTALRRVPVPATEPPYDNELPPVVPRRLPGSFSTPAVQGTLALAFVLPSGLPATPQPPVLTLAPPLVDDDPEFAPRPTPRHQLPDPRRWAAQLIQALMEVLSGDRPLTQLIRWTTPEVLGDIRRATDAQWHGPRSAATGASADARRTARTLVRSVHVSEPVDGAAEVCATVSRGTRAAAVALRLDGIDGRWQCTALQLG